MSLRAEFDSSLFFDTFQRSDREVFLGNGTVTRPGLVACLNCLWLPACATSNQPSASSYIVNYADDLVICCRGRAEEALAAMRVMMTKLTLTANETKTRVSKLPEEKFDFLGYTFGRCYSTKTGRAYLGTVPAKTRVIRICQAISSETGRNKTLLDHQTVVTKLNQMMNGWANCFCLGPVSKTYQAVERHGRKRLRQWFCAKYKASWPATGKFPEAALHAKFGLVRLSERTHSFSWAKS
jgi:RNA-directed DNA polymerase